jgi:hypothetical protein
MFSCHLPVVSLPSSEPKTEDGRPKIDDYSNGNRAIFVYLAPLGDSLLSYK